MYNPYVAAFAALTNADARRFYVDTAIEHTFLTVAVAGIAINNTIEAGKSFRQFHDSHLVPFTLLAIATVVEFFASPEAAAAEAPQPLLPGFTPAGLLPESKPQERVLVTPAVERIAASGFTPNAIAQMKDEGILDESPDAVIDYDSMTVTQLRKLAAGKVKRPSKYSKAELIEALQACA